MPTLQRIAYYPAFLVMGALTSVSKAFAQANGNLGLNEINNVQGRNAATNNDIKGTAIYFLNLILNFLALLAVVFIIVAGIRLIVSQGEQEQKDKAKKTIIYVVIGLIVVLLAKIIVNFVVSQTLNNNVRV